MIVCICNAKNNLYFEHPFPVNALTYFTNERFMFTKHARVSIIMSKLMHNRTADLSYRRYCAASNGTVITPHNLVMYRSGMCGYPYTYYGTECTPECDCATNPHFQVMLPEIQANTLDWASIPIERLHEYVNM